MKLPVHLLVALAVAAAGCTTQPATDLAGSLASKDQRLASALQPAPGTWEIEGDEYTSPGWRSARLGPYHEVGARLPRFAGNPMWVGIGQSERFTLRLSPEGAADVPAAEDDGRLFYPEAYASTDLLVTATRRQVEWFLLLRDRRAPDEFTWQVDLPPGLQEVRAGDDGGLCFADKLGQARLCMPPAYAIDSRDVRRQAELIWQPGRLTLRLDSGGLTYPVLLDPLIEVPTWIQLAPTPAPRSYAAMAYDSIRGRTVLFGSIGGTNRDTWEWDGVAWKQMSTGGPSARIDHAMAFDSGRGVTVLMGGRNGSNSYADTWEWNGSGWTSRGSSGPSARYAHAMAYDSDRGRTVLYGGVSSTGVNDQIYEWDGSTWYYLGSGGAPGMLKGHSMAFNSVRGRTMLFGGGERVGASCCTPQYDLLEWDGSSWTTVTDTAPIGGEGKDIVYDSVLDRLVVYSGSTYQWKDGSWTLITSSGPPSRSNYAIAYDSGRGRTVLFGGYAGIAKGDTWELDGSTWALVADEIFSPPSRYWSAMVFDSGRGRTVLFGGHDGTDYYRDTWEWNGITWQNRASAPDERAAHAMAYDSLRGVTVTFGGRSDVAGYFGTTWEYNGSTWTNVPVAGPPARGGHAMVFDSGRGVTVLFGGSSSDSLDSTFEYNGSSWVEAATTGPGYRYGHAMAYDSFRGVTVLFGGANPNRLGDTWEWDGSDWNEIVVAGPTARYEHAMAFDSDTNRVVLYGGWDGDYSDETWEWDGAIWTLVTSGTPEARHEHLMAFDSIRGRTVLFGGYGRDETWEYYVRLACTADEDCTPLDQCHVAGVCNVTSGVCTDPVAVDGTPCDDADACTQSDACQMGVCTGSDPVDCPPLSQCHEARCDPADGSCIDQFKPDGEACDDTDGCTQSDTCQAGVCTGDDPVVCTALDQCHLAGTCDPATGICSDPPAADGQACDDSDACTQTDTCQTGVCTGFDEVVCTALDQCHEAGTCDPLTGVCSDPLSQDGKPCDDADACTQTDTCLAGQCDGANPVTCTPLDQCHLTGTCDPATGICSDPLRPDGEACDDSDACTQTDTCQTGVCTGDDEVVCTALDQCHLVGTCDPGTGVCSNPQAADGSNCDDGDACTRSDSCQAGACVGADPVVCVALDQCHQAGDCDPATGICSDPEQANDTACDDGDACTQSDTCQAGVCTGTDPVVCTPIDDCHLAGECDPATGDCSNPLDTTDTDGDGVYDCDDGCVDDPDKSEPGACGCGVPDTDTDSDTTPDCLDDCVDDPAKTDPGVCGCGVPDTDADSDGTPDCNDDCPADPDKTEPGVCGCGAPDDDTTTDTDGDGTPDCTDPDDDNDGVEDPTDPASHDSGICGDSDADTCDDCSEGSDQFGPAPDNLPDDDGLDTDGDGACDQGDDDDDGDGIPDDTDNCPLVANEDQADLDDDGIGSACDPSEETPNDVTGKGCGCGTPGRGLFPLALLIAGLLAGRRRRSPGDGSSGPAI